MMKDKASIRAFLKGVADFSSSRFGRTAPEAIQEEWITVEATRPEGIPGRILERLEEVLAQNPGVQPALETLFQLALAARKI